MSRLLPAGAALAAAVTMSLTAASADAATTRTPFMLGASGYGSQVSGGQIPVGSGTTGKAIIGCTNKAGLKRTNATTSVAIPGGYGTLDGVKSTASTVQKGGTVSSTATHNIAKVVLAQSALGELDLTAVHSQARAWHDANGYHSTSKATLGGISFTVGGSTHTYPIPSPGQSQAIPGLGSLSLGGPKNSHGAHQASAEVAGVKLHIDSSNTTITIADAQAHISDRTLNGIFQGVGSAVQAKAVQNYAGVDPEPVLHMPCQGTGGKVLQRSGASAPLSTSSLTASGLSTHEQGSQTATGAKGYEEGDISHLDLGGGQLVVDARGGKVNVAWNKTTHKWVVNSKGTKAGSITAGGKSYSLPALDGLSIPSVATFKTDVVHRGRHGGSVTALQIKLLDGSGAVINLGNATLRINPFRK